MSIIHHRYTWKDLRKGDVLFAREGPGSCIISHVDTVFVEFIRFYADSSIAVHKLARNGAVAQNLISDGWVLIATLK